MLVSIPPHISIAQFMGYFKCKSSLMIFDRHANLKYKYGQRSFWCRGYYVDTVGGNKKNTAINADLKAAGSTYTYETLTAYEEYVYDASEDDPNSYTIWQADPHLITGKQEGDIVSYNQNNAPTNEVTIGKDEDGYYYSINHTDTDGAWTYFSNGITSNTSGFGWMNNTDLLAALSKYMYFSCDYRFYTAGTLPSNAKIYIQATTPYESSMPNDNYLAVLSAVNSEEWMSCAPQKLWNNSTRFGQTL